MRDDGRSGCLARVLAGMRHDGTTSYFHRVGQSRGKVSPACPPSLPSAFKKPPCHSFCSACALSVPAAAPSPVCRDERVLEILHIRMRTAWRLKSVRRLDLRRMASFPPSSPETAFLTHHARSGPKSTTRTGGQVSEPGVRLEISLNGTHAHKTVPVRMCVPHPAMLALVRQAYRSQGVANERFHSKTEIPK